MEKNSPKMAAYEERAMKTGPIFETEQRKLHQFKWKLIGAVVIACLLVSGYVGTVYMLSNQTTQKSSMNGGQNYDEISGPPSAPKIYEFEDFTVFVDLQRDLVIVKNSTTGNCYVTNVHEVSFVMDDGNIDGDLALVISEAGKDEFYESSTAALTYTRHDTIPKKFLASTTHEEVVAMCLKTTFWANQSVARSLAFTYGGRPRRSQCCYTTYSCTPVRRCSTCGIA